MMKGWKQIKLGDVAPYWNSKVENKELNEENYISAENMFPEKGGVTKSSYISISGKATSFKHQDILVSNIRPYFKKIWFANKNGGCSNDVIVFRTKQNIAYSPFIYYYLSKDDFFDFMMAGANGTKMPRGNKKSIPQYKINLPPLKTQRKIATILSTYDDIIENNLKRIKLLEEQAQQTYTEWFVRLKFPGYEDAKFDTESGLPVGWEISTLGEFAKTSSGGTPSRKKESEYYENGTVPWVKTGELKNFILIDSKEKITELGLSKSSAKLFPKKTVLLAMYGNTIGETTFLTFEASTNQACCGFLVKNEVYKSYFLHQFLLNQKEYILNFRMGAAQENISQGIIQGIKFKKPSKDVLLEFEKQIAPKYDLIEILYNQNKHLKEARDILLPRLMMGIIDVDSLEVGEVANNFKKD